MRRWVMLNAMTGPSFLAAFSQLTGIKFRLGAHDVEAQAIALAAAGFGVRDIELVVLYIERQIRRGEGGYNAASLRWGRLMGVHGSGDEFQLFQERLGLANEALKRGWRPVLKLSHPRDIGNPVTTAPAPVQRSDPALFEAGRAAMAATRKALSGQSNL